MGAESILWKRRAIAYDYTEHTQDNHQLLWAQKKLLDNLQSSQAKYVNAMNKSTYLFP
jgi:hypothetical protein